MSEPAAPGALRRLTELYSRLLSILLALSVGILVLPVTLQVFSRYTSLIPHYIWTEEMARFLLVWTVMIGAMLAMKERIHFVVDVFPRLSPRHEAVVELVSGVFTLVFAAAFVWWGWEFTEFAWFRISEMAELPLWLIHIAWPMLGVTWLIFQGGRMAEAIRVLRGTHAP